MLSCENKKVVNNQTFKIPTGCTGISLRNTLAENYGRHDYIYTKIIYDCINSEYYYVDIQRELPTIAVDMDRSRYAFFIFARCAQFTT